METCATCKHYDESQHWCKAFGGFTFARPDDTCSAWAWQEDTCAVCPLASDPDDIACYFCRKTGSPYAEHFENHQL